MHFSSTRDRAARMLLANVSRRTALELFVSPVTVRTGVCHFRCWKEGNPGFRRRLFDGLSVCEGGLGGILHASSSPHLDEGSHYPISPVISAAETFVFRSSFGQSAMWRARGRENAGVR